MAEIKQHLGPKLAILVRFTPGHHIPKNLSKNTEQFSEANNVNIKTKVNHVP